MIRGHAYEVLPCNYIGEISQKLDLALTFNWRVLLTIFGAPKYAYLPKGTRMQNIEVKIKKKNCQVLPN